MSTPRTRVVQIDPKTALKWLEGNTHNRPIRHALVDKYAAVMRQGGWKLTHQGIAFDEKGTLIDGQHRLYAVWWLGENGLPDIRIPMLVTEGLPMATQLVIDDHAKRSAVDVGQLLSGMKTLTSKHIAAARVIWIYGFGRDYKLLTNATMVGFTKKYFEGLDFIVRECFGGRGHRGATQAGVLGVMTQAFYAGVNRERLKRFAQILTGERAEADEDAAHLLRNYLILKAQGQRSPQSEVYGKAQRALHSFLKRERLQKLYGTSEQLFPIPGMPAPKAPSNGRREAKRDEVAV